MNERIGKLAEEAGLLGPSSRVGDSHSATEKFVELLVREHLGIWDLMDNGNDVEGYIDMEDYPKAIINHFGLRKIDDDLSKAEEFENWCKESDDGAAE